MSEDSSTEINMLTARCAELEAKLAAAKSKTDILPAQRPPAVNEGVAAEGLLSAFRRQTFSEIFLNHSGYLSDKWAQYLQIYDFELQPMIARRRPLRLLEIGVQNGGSLQIWHQYLPAGSQIYGLDIDERCRQLDFPPQVKVLVGDAGDPATLNQLLGEEVFDIIIDDGSHQSKDVIVAFEALLPRLAAGGKYFIEDLHTSYWPSYGGGFRRAGTTIEHVKKVVDALHADYFQASDLIEDRERNPLTDLNPQIGRVSFYDSMAVIINYVRPKTSRFNRVLSGREIKVTGVDDLLEAVAANPNEITFSRDATDVVVSAAARKISELRQEKYREQADIEQRAATEAALRGEIDQRAATEAKLRVEIEQRAATEAKLRVEIEQRAATEAKLQDEIERGTMTEAALRNALDQAEREADRELNERTTAATVLRTELDVLRATLAANARDLRERTAAAEALQDGITSSRTQLAAAERDAMAMRRELATLRSERDAARDVGRAALASLRNPPEPIPEVPRNAGWVMLLLRRLGLPSSSPFATSPVIADD